MLHPPSTPSSRVQNRSAGGCIEINKHSRGASRRRVTCRCVVIHGSDLVGDFSYLQNQGAPNHPVLYGVWSVARANVDWKQIVFDDYGVFAAQSREGSMQYYSQKTNAAARSITISGYRDPHAG